MTAQVVFVAARAENAVAVPLSALGTDAQGSSARVLGADGQPETRSLRLGARSRHQVEVLEGLQAGERLVTGEQRVGGGPDWLQW